MAIAADFEKVYTVGSGLIKTCLIESILILFLN